MKRQKKPHRINAVKRGKRTGREEPRNFCLPYLAAYLCFLLIGGKSFIEGCLNIYRHSFQEYLLWDLSIKSTQLLFNQLLLDSAKLLAPIFMVVLVAGLVSNYAQVGFMFNTESLKMNLGKINPIEGAKNILSMRSLVELLKSIFKISVTSIIVFIVIWNSKSELFLLGEKNIWDAARFIGTLIIKIGLYVSASLFVMAIADFMYQKFEFEKKFECPNKILKMNTRKWKVTHI